MGPRSMQEVIAAAVEKFRREGQHEGALDRHSELLLRVLELRGVAVSHRARCRILRAQYIDELTVWFDRALSATCEADLFEEESRVVPTADHLREEGRVIGERSRQQALILRVLSKRGVLTDEIVSHVRACADLRVLDAWFDAALLAEHPAEAITGAGRGSPSSNNST